MDAPEDEAALEERRMQMHIQAMITGNTDNQAMAHVPAPNLPEPVVSEFDDRMKRWDERKRQALERKKASKLNGYGTLTRAGLADRSFASAPVNPSTEVEPSVTKPSIDSDEWSVGTPTRQLTWASGDIGGDQASINSALSACRDALTPIASGYGSEATGYGSEATSRCRQVAASSSIAVLDCPQTGGTSAPSLDALIGGLVEAGVLDKDDAFLNVDQPPRQSTWTPGVTCPAGLTVGALPILQESSKGSWERQGSESATDPQAQESKDSLNRQASGDSKESLERQASGGYACEEPDIPHVWNSEELLEAQRDKLGALPDDHLVCADLASNGAKPASSTEGLEAQPSSSSDTAAYEEQLRRWNERKLAQHRRKTNGTHNVARTKLQACRFNTDPTGSSRREDIQFRLGANDDDGSWIIKGKPSRQSTWALGSDPGDPSSASKALQTKVDNLKDRQLFASDSTETTASDTIRRGQSMQSCDSQEGVPSKLASCIKGTDPQPSSSSDAQVVDEHTLRWSARKEERRRIKNESTAIGERLKAQVFRSDPGINPSLKYFTAVVHSTRRFNSNPGIDEVAVDDAERQPMNATLDGHVRRFDDRKLEQQYDENVIKARAALEAFQDSRLHSTPP